MMIALPNPDRSFTCTLFWPKQGEGSFDALTGDDAVDASLRRRLSRTCRRSHRTWSTTTCTTRSACSAPSTRRRGTSLARGCHVAVLGDAAHAIVPFYGQGANCAFEDVVELDRCLDDTGGYWARALPLFEAAPARAHRGDRRDGAGNFVEMRDKVASPVFRPRKRVEHALERALPGLYVSQYELVSFSTTPYADVRRRVRRQQLRGRGDHRRRRSRRAPRSSRDRLSG